MRTLIAATVAAALATGCASTPEEDAVEAMREALIAVDGHDLAKAATAARRASELRPGFVDPLMLLAAISEQEGDLDEARRCYTQVLRHDPTDTAAGVALGVTFVRERRFDEARGWFEKAIAADPGYEAAAYNLASLAKQENDLETAAAWFDVAATLDLRDPKAPTHIAAIRLVQGRPQDALVAADLALRRDPAFRDAQAVRARALQELGRN